MSSKRTVVLMGILLVLLLGYLALSLKSSGQLIWFQNSVARLSEPAPLAGENTLSGVKVEQDKNGRWTVTFDCFYTGSPRDARLTVESLQNHPSSKEVGQPARWPRATYSRPLTRGVNHMSFPLAYPGEGRTDRVVVQLRVPVTSSLTGYTVITSQAVDQMIEWPSLQTWMLEQQIAGNSQEENLKRAIDLIDSGYDAQINEAKSILELLVRRDANLDQAYVELARVAMKLNWGPEGLHQAEALISSALQIQPDSVNAKILLGYVYAHQENYSKAEALFVDAAKSKPSNLWLWVNWGELLAMQKKLDGAILKYREAIANPVTHNTNDRARKDAYAKLLAILERRKDLDGMEALYKQRVADYGTGSCYSTGYARFLLLQRGDTQGAINLAQSALNKDCEDSPARQVLGLAQYVKWANTNGQASIESLNQARIYLPAGPMPLYLLATSDRTAPTIRKLIAAGERIDQTNNEKITALAYALQQHDLDAAKRLLGLGAHWDVAVGYEGMPVAFIPVINGDVEATRILQKYGADYSKLRYNGASALDIAKQLGNSPLIEALTRNHVSA